MTSFSPEPGYTALMNTDPKTCDRAVKSRDARFDGRFFTGVTSTGIFCRPVCPANTPREENCTFFANAAAAIEAGFRPCLRCRPEAAPGGPAWNGTSTTVNRAMRLINEGALDEMGVDHLAARLGIGERHLRRLFIEHVGVGPKAVAQTRRVLFAKKLINETTLPLTEIALAAGFGSIRRFNSTFQKLYGKPPRDLRRLGQETSGSNGSSLNLKLALRPPYDAEQVFGFLKSRAIEGVEVVEDGAYKRTISLNGHSGILKVRHGAEENCLSLSVDLDDTASLKTIVERTRRLFDVDADSAAINAHLSQDPILAPSIKARPGLRVPGCWDVFEIAVRAVLGQQVSVAAARTFAGRLADTFGEPLAPASSEALNRIFPTAERLAGADLTTIGLTGKRAESLNVMARAFADGTLALEQAEDADAIEARLTSLPGIGPWTARYICLRAFGEPDAFPSGDLGLLNALKAHGETLSIKELDQRAESWRPWRAYAALHLWAMLPQPKEKRKQ